MGRKAAVILAAGKGSRFKSENYKLLTPINGIPMIAMTLAPVHESDFSDIVVVIGAHSNEMRSVLEKYPVRIVENPLWENGQSTSLIAGMLAVKDKSDKVCLILGDQPYLKTSTLSSLLTESDRYPDEIIVPFYQGKRGNPIIVPSYRYEKLLELSHGDEGGKQLLREVVYHIVEIDDPGIIRDVDVIEDLEQHERDQLLAN